MKRKVIRKIFCLTIISIVLINLICVNFGEVFAAEMGNVKVSNMIKDAVAKWYYIMRLIVIAFMLILLIFIGIKMAISTIASEKAVYKKMLVDWVAGMIIVFSIHYIMIFILTVNDNVVEALRPLVAEPSQIQEESQFGGEENKKTSSQLETTLYESARTRAYSLKLTDGFTGMIIYGMLVYFAWRYTFMYFRRMINIIILTLLAPAVSASYAFNKVMTGKAKIFSTWLSEFIMNVAVQTVHVIMYASFVSTALILSLESLPGVILAAVLLNFMTKADGILRGIFKLSGGSGSLAGDMTDRSTFAELKKEVKTMTNVMVGGAITRKAAKLTYRVATKPVRAFAEKKFGDLMEARANDPQYIANQRFEALRKEHDARDAYENYKKTLGLDQKESDIIAELDALKAKAKTVGSKVELDKIVQEIGENKKKQKQLEEEEQQAQDDFLKYYHSSGTVKETIKDGVAQIFDADQYTKTITKSELKRYEELKSLSKEEFEQQFRRPPKPGEEHYKQITREEKKMFEEFQKLEKQGKLKVGYRRKISTRRNKDDEDARWRRMMGKKTDSVGMRVAQKMKVQNILGLSADEKKELDKAAKFYKESIMGIASGIAGWATIGNNFWAGIALLGRATAAKGEMRRRAGYSYNRPRYKRDERYKFKAFSKGTQKTIYEEAERQIKFIESEMARRNAARHPRLISAIMNGSKVVVKPILVAGVVVSGVCVHAPLQGKVPIDMAKGTRLKRSLTFMEEDKLAAIHDKKLRDDFKDMKKRFAYLNSQELENDFDKKFASFEGDIYRETKSKSKTALLIQEANAMEDAIVVSHGANKFIVQIKDDGEINKLTERAVQTDGISNLTRKEKLSIIKSDIAKNETALIEDAIVRVCAQKGIRDVANLDMTDFEKIEIKKEILGSLEKRGIVQKGEISLDDDLVSNEKISTVHEGLVEEQIKLDVANRKVEKRLVEEAILTYMAKKGISDKKILQNNSAKAEIYDIIKERLMTEDSKKSADVIKKLNGGIDNKFQQELSDEIKVLVDKTSTKVQTSSLLKKDKGDDGKADELTKKLVERQTRREINKAKEELEKALYLGEDALELVVDTSKSELDKKSQKKLDLINDLIEIGRQNKEAEKAGDKTAKKERKKQTSAEMNYYIQKDGSKRFNTSKDGSKKADEKDGSKDLSKLIKDLETRLHGPHDVIDFLNKPRSHRS